MASPNPARLSLAPGFFLPSLRMSYMGPSLHTRTLSCWELKLLLCPGTCTTQCSRLLPLGPWKVFMLPKSVSLHPHTVHTGTSKATLHVQLTNVSGGHAHPLFTQTPHLDVEVHSHSARRTAGLHDPQLTRKVWLRGTSREAPGGYFHVATQSEK